MKKSKQPTTTSSKTKLNTIETHKQSFSFIIRNVGKYKFLTSEEILPEKRILEKIATVKRFEYLLLSTELKKQTDISNKQ